MSKRYEYTGIVQEVRPVEILKDDFKKRKLIVTNDLGDDAKYPDCMPFVFKQDRVKDLDGITVGSRVKIEFAIDTRRWEGPKGVMFFVDLTCLHIEVLSRAEEPKKDDEKPMSDDPDDLPF